MSSPRKKKSSRDDQKRKFEYSSTFGENSQLFDPDPPATKEKPPPPHQANDFPASGRRSTDEYTRGLYHYWESLSVREQDVTILICKGYADNEIASSLKISFTTVRSYLKSVFQKTDTHNRKQVIVRFAGFKFPRDITPNI